MCEPLRSWFASAGQSPAELPRLCSSDPAVPRPPAAAGQSAPSTVTTHARATIARSSCADVVRHHGITGRTSDMIGGPASRVEGVADNGGEREARRRAQWRRGAAPTSRDPCGTVYGRALAGCPLCAGVLVFGLGQVGSLLRHSSDLRVFTAGDTASVRHSQLPSTDELLSPISSQPAESQ